MKSIERMIASRYFWSSNRGSSYYHVVTGVFTLLTLVCLFLYLKIHHLPSFSERSIYLKYGVYIGLLITLVVALFVEFRRRLSVFTTISVSGFLLGSSSIILVTVAMGGMHSHVSESALAIRPHLRVTTFASHFGDEKNILKKIRENPDVVLATPYIDTDVLIESHGNTQAVTLNGIIPDEYSKIVEIEKMMRAGSFGTWTYQKESVSDSDFSRKMILGVELAGQLRSYVGNSVIISYFEMGPTGRTAKTIDFNVAGEFESGSYDVDSHWAYLPLEQAQILAGSPHEIKGVYVRLKDREKSNEVKKTLSQVLGPAYQVETAEDLIGPLLMAVKLEKIAMTSVLSLIILIAAFSVLSSGATLAAEKKKQIAVLRTMGMTMGSIQRTFLWYGLLIGAVGAGAGVVISGLVTLLAQYWQIPLANAFYLTHIPVKVNVSQSLFIFLISLGFVIVGIWYPARFAASQKPLDGLK